MRHSTQKRIKIAHKHRHTTKDKNQHANKKLYTTITPTQIKTISSDEHHKNPNKPYTFRLY